VLRLNVLVKTPLAVGLLAVAVIASMVAVLAIASPARATPGICAVADTVVSYSEGANLTGNKDPNEGLVYDGKWVSLGHGGQIVVAFLNTSVLDGPGVDILIAEANFRESAEILVSDDGVTYHSLGVHQVITELSLDIASTGLTSFKYVKIVDDNVDPELGVPSLEAGFDLDSVEAYNCGEPEPTPTPSPTPTNTPTPTPTNTPTPTPTNTPIPTPTNTPTPTPTNTPTPTPPAGGEGCTPGYWKQEHHFGSWVTYEPGDSFDTVFGVDSSFATLLDGVSANGGGENALARHAVAALLNAASAEVDSSFTTADVIQMVQDAYESGDFETTKNKFEADNESGCPLGRDEGEEEAAQSASTGKGKK
jgi:hypothetical protein